MTDPGSYEGWVHGDECVICPRCNAFIPCGADLPSILAAVSRHDCHADPGVGHYLPATGRHRRPLTD